ncbi:hypothetical protein ACFY05_41915 [Microtetraspora fusca]|uniref:Uncharacterized protein n=1 Tax=Microtetraspora fusca TaxID=1997 RepID=A0ABW6VMH6_MICFU
MDETTNQLAELPPEVLAEMAPGERLAYLAYLEEPCPAEVTAAAMQVWAQREIAPAHHSDEE